MNFTAEETKTSPLPLYAALLVILIVYGAGAASIASHHAIWSPDCGARFVQIQSILQHWPHWWVSYPAQALDPEHHNSPLYFFEFRHGDRIYVFYSFFFALISAFLFQHFGFIGLSFLSVLGGLATAVGTYGIARLLRVRYPLAPMLIVALASPLIIYSIVFWDHSLTTGIATVCLYLCLRAIATRQIRLWFAAGVVLGAGLWFHEILIPCLPALVFAAWWARRRTPWIVSSGLFILGVALLLAPLVIINKSVYGTLMGPHLSNNRLGSSGAIMDFLKNPREWGLGAIYTLFAWGNANPGFTWELKDWVAHPWPALQAQIHVSIFMAVPVIGWIVLSLARIWRDGWGGAAISLLLFAGLLLNGCWVYQHIDWPHSVFLACPFLALAFAASWPTVFSRTRNDTPRQQTLEDETDEPRLLWQILVWFTFIYTLFNLLKPTLGGTEWGSRHLLVIVPILTLLAWSAVESLLPEESPTFYLSPQSGVLLTGMGMLLVMSVALQYHAFKIIDAMHEENHQLSEAIAAAPDKVIVSSVWWAGMNAAPIYMDKQMLYAGDPDHPAPPLFERMRQAGIKNYTLLGFQPYDLANFSGAVGYVPIPDTIRDTTLYLRLNRFELSPGPPPQQLQGP
ncbi:MAG: hypothetical protein JO316_08305 [Abitibacteriaceae bacterium]|nr:hypothetical protein [Abditibacteriaceae bacterium]